MIILFSSSKEISLELAQTLNTASKCAHLPGINFKNRARAHTHTCTLIMIILKSFLYELYTKFHAPTNDYLFRNTLPLHQFR